MNFPAQFSSCVLAAAMTSALLVSQASVARADDAAAGEYVRLALAHEAYGKEEVGRHLLEAALLESPDYAPAHWHLGQVQVDGRWVPAADAHRLADQNEMLSVYRQLREEALDDPRRELSLAKWCRRQGWEDHEKLHYSRVALNPAADRRLRAEAMRKLELVNANGELLSEEEITLLQKQAERVEAAMKKWRGPLEEWALTIVGEDEAEAALAAEELAKVDDPSVIPVLEPFVLQSGPVFGKHVVALLGRFSQVESTQSLARFAVVSPWVDVRHAAIDQLSRRPLHDYVPMLLDELVAPVRSRFLITIGPLGSVRSQVILTRRNAGGNLVFAREHLTQSGIGAVLTRSRSLARERTEADASSNALAQQEFSAARAMLKSFSHQEAVAEYNAPILASNERILEVLRRLTGERIGPDPADWQQWWRGYNETETQKPTYFAYYATQINYVTPYYQFDPTPTGSCFSAGTPVWTETGLAPIEAVKVGDRVLSQDLDSGELTYKLVLRTTALPPTSDTVRVVADAGSVDMTKAHVVWVDGKGWRMSKELEPGDHLHGVSGPMPVDTVDELPPELEVYNLVVADFNTFFVGESGVLVHDITYVTRRKPTTALVPGFTPGEPRAERNLLTSPAASLVRQVINGWRQ